MVRFLPMRCSTYGLLLLQVTASQLAHKCFPSPRAGHAGCITQKCAWDAIMQRILSASDAAGPSRSGSHGNAPLWLTRCFVHCPGGNLATPQGHCVHPHPEPDGTFLFTACFLCWTIQGRTSLWSLPCSLYSTWIPVFLASTQQDQSSWHATELPWLLPSLRRLLFSISIWQIRTFLRCPFEFDRLANLPGFSYYCYYFPNFIYFLFLSLMI